MDKAKKKRIKKYISWIALVAVVAYLAVMPMIAESNVEVDGPVASILSGTVETSSIDTVLHGGGTLSEESGVEITIPSGVKLTRFLVENDEAVTEGQPLAEVDKISVMTAITGVQETLDYLLEEMNEAKNADTKDEVVATGGGLVKVVYAEAGDDVMDVILEHGALAVLSLDGMMAVRLNVTTSYAAGDSVSVTLSDGTVATGWVESNLDGVLVVTVEDDGYEIGEAVTVVSADGIELGNGELYIHNAWKATAYSGTVKSVKIKVGDDVSTGKTIFTLSDVDVNAELEQLRAKHQEYEELMLELFKLYQDTTINAPCDGVVSGIDQDSIHLLSGSNTGYVLTFLSNAPGADPDAGYSNYVGQITGTLGSKWVVQMNPTQQTVADYIADIGNVDTNVDNMTSPGDMEMVTVYKLVNGEWEIGTAAEGDILLFAWGESGCVWAVYVGHQNLPTEPDASEPTVPDVTDPTTPSEPSIDPTTPSDPSTPPVTPSEPSTDPTIPSGPSTGITTPSIPSMPQIPSTGGMPSFGGYGGGTVTAEPEFELYDLDGSTILEITTQDTMTLTITVDEQNLHKVNVGMTAVVTVDALKGETYSATVTKVYSKGINSGGSSKFSVELTLDRSENMLDGMSATVAFTLDTAVDILIIPMAALNQQGSKTVVYTGYDENSDKLINPVEVTIGISDGSYAQILSGLDEGAVYYYSYYDTLELSTAVSD